MSDRRKLPWETRPCEKAAAARMDRELEYEITWQEATTNYKHCFACGRFVEMYPYRTEHRWLPVCRIHASPFEKARRRILLDTGKEVTREDWEKERVA